MKRKSTKPSAFFNRRTLLGVFIIFGGIGLALFALGRASAQRAPSRQSSNSQPLIQAQYRGVMRVVKFDISPPLRSMKPLAWNSCTQREDEEGGPLPVRPLGPVVPDSVVQRMLGRIGIPAPIITFDGNSNLCGCSPPDPNGAVGPNHVVTMANLHFQIFNKSGVSLFGPAANNTLWSGFGGSCQTQNAGDPVVIYDQLADRWLLTQFTAGSPPFFECVALSQTNDPLGSYYRWAIATGPSGNNFPDYPKAGMWPDAYYFSTREFQGSPSGPFVGVGAYALDRVQALAGNPNPTMVGFLAPPSPAYVVGDGLLPSTLDGMTPPPVGSPNYFVGSEDNNGPYGAPQDALTIWKFHYDPMTPVNSTFVLTNTLPTAPFNSVLALCGGGRNCIPQPNTTNRIDFLNRERPLFRLAYRNFGSHESLVTNQSVSAGTGPNGEVAGVRWYELRSPNSSPVIFQQGTYAPGLSDGIHRWLGSIAMNSLGDIALGYSASNGTNPSVFPSVYYTGRHAADPLGQMTLGEGSIINGTGSQTGSQRWGDYTAMVVDPADDRTFWYINEYVPTTSSIGWRLRIGAFNLGGGCTPSWSAGPDLPTALIRAVGVFFPADGNFYLLGGRTADTAGSDFQHVLRYSPVSNTWTQMGVTLPDNQMNNMACGVLTLGGTPEIYCVGGSAATQTTASARVFYYNPVSDSAVTLGSGDNWPGAMGTILPGGFAETGNKMYILGGFNINVASTNQIWSFDPNAAVGSKWVLAPVTTPVGIMYAPTCAISGIVYVTGASDYSGGTVIDTTTSFSFNPATNTIGSIPPIPRATGETRALAFNGNIYVMGGGRVAPNPSNEVDIFGPSGWTIGPPFTTPRRNFPTDTNGTDHIWLAGGYASDGITPLASMERFQCPSAVTITSAVSRKTHGAAGTFDVALPLTGADGVECRTTGGTNDHTMVVTFSGNVTVTGSPQAQVTSGTGCVGSGGACTGNVTVSGNVVTVPLTGVTDQQNINVRINGVNGAADAPTTDFNIPMGVLAGDTNANRTVNAADVAQTKSQLGQVVGAGNFRNDVNANGTINAADTALVKQNSGHSIP